MSSSWAQVIALLDVESSVEVLVRAHVLGHGGTVVVPPQHVALLLVQQIRRDLDEALMLRYAHIVGPHVELGEPRGQVGVE